MEYRHIDVTPMTPTIGAMIQGVDLNNVASDAVYDEIREALWRHHAVFFRDQPIEPEAQVALGHRFGELTRHEFMETIDDDGQVQRIVQEGYGISPNSRWHTDVTFRAQPNMVGILRAVELPPIGGDTLWCSTGAAFDAMPDPIKTMLLGLDAEHDMFWSRRWKSSGEVERSLESEIRELEENPISIHPAVINHPVTGRLTLYINSNWTKKFVGVDLELSYGLIGMLWEWVKKPEFQVRFKWEKDSVALWDNFATQHLATLDYEPHRRTMHRVIAGSAIPTLDREALPEHLRPPASPPDSITRAKAARAAAA